MKIAVAATGDNLEAQTDPRFGRCAYFVILDGDTMESEAVQNTAAAQGSGAGIAAAQLVANVGAEVVVAGNFGPNAHQALSAGGIQTYGGATGTVRQAIEAFTGGQLQPFGGPNVEAKSGMGQGPDVGGGRGMGGGGGMGGGMGMGRGMGMAGGFAAQAQQPPVSPEMGMPPQGPAPMWGPQAEPSPERQIQMLRAEAQMIQAQLDWINDQIKSLEEGQQ